MPRATIQPVKAGDSGRGGSRRATRVGIVSSVGHGDRGVKRLALVVGYLTTARRIALPGSASRTSSPSRMIGTPFTTTWRMPTDRWLGWA